MTMQNQCATTVSAPSDILDRIESDLSGLMACFPESGRRKTVDDGSESAVRHLRKLYDTRAALMLRIAGELERCRSVTSRVREMQRKLARVEGDLAEVADLLAESRNATASDRM